MPRYLILLLVVLMPLKALAASYGVCSQELVSHGQQHEVKSAHAAHETASKAKSQTANQECADCNLCHTACGTFVSTTGNEFFVPISPASTPLVTLSLLIKTQPSDPPYRPKWLALA